MNDKIGNIIAVILTITGIYFFAWGFVIGFLWGLFLMAMVYDQHKDKVDYYRTMVNRK